MKIFHEVLFFIKIIVFTYLMSLLLLGILALVSYKTDCSAKVISGGIIAIYFISAFIGGLFAGKVKKNRRIIWGITVGLLYLAGLLIVSIIVGKGISGGIEVAAALGAAVAGGIIGGMVS